MSPKIASKLVQQIVNIRPSVGSISLKVLELFRCLLAIFLRILRLSWTALDPKNLKDNSVSSFLQMQVFGAMKLLMALLGPSWADLVPKWVPKMSLKVVQKLVQQMTPEITKQITHLAPKLPNMASWGLVSKMPPNRPRWPKTIPRDPQERPRWAKIAPTIGQDSSRWLCDGPR